MCLIDWKFVLIKLLGKEVDESSEVMRLLKKRINLFSEEKWWIKRKRCFQILTEE